MATQNDSLAWWERVKSALNIGNGQEKRLMQTALLANQPNTAVGLAAGNLLGGLLGRWLYPKKDNPNMGINEDMSKAQSNAYVNDRLNEVDKNSALGQYLANHNTGFESNPTWEQAHDINEMAQKIAQETGKESWNSMTPQYDFDQQKYYDDEIAKRFGIYNFRR